MKKNTKSPKWAQWLLTPAEFFVFGLAGFVIYVAKVQDEKMGNSGYSEARLPRTVKAKRPNYASTAYFPTLVNTTYDPQEDGEVLPSLESLNPYLENTQQKEAISAQKGLFMRNFDALVHLQANNLSKEDHAIMMRDGCITYDFIEECFQSASKKPVEQMIISDVLGNPIMANHIFKAIQERFGVPVKESEMFAKNPLMMLSDWGLFVAQAQR
jgi:hypothetical protein